MSPVIFSSRLVAASAQRAPAKKPEATPAAVQITRNCRRLADAECLFIGFEYSEQFGKSRRVRRFGASASCRAPGKAKSRRHPACKLWSTNWTRPGEGNRLEAYATLALTPGAWPRRPTTRTRTHC